MIVKYSKAFFTDLRKIKNMKLVEEIEFITETANSSSQPNEIPGYKPLRQYTGMSRIEISPYRIGVEIIGGYNYFQTHHS